ncbi:hypothetical protein CDL12_09215 [Handroanthus impetiginosus]|uniref:CCHC-type domain-containing protein n=1 Tax=Handroanthus impetiginosus TaxID=429701 RepID=A0A2G9HKR4_9LAMI|nr:hypothetical protein CDL12_09215 [Handroanthus impetiginosus]
MASIKEMATNIVKLDRFEGGNFIRWQNKMHFLFTTIKVVYVLTQEKPVEKENETIAETRYKLKMDETIIVSSIIDKLPPSWKDVKRSLKHNKEDMSLEELGNHLRIEEDYRKREETKVEENSSKNSEVSKVHVVKEKESNKAPKGNNNKKGKQHYSMKPNGQKFKKRKGPCYHYGKMGHIKSECHHLKKNQSQNQNQNQNKNPNALGSNEKFVAMISEVNMVQNDEAYMVD